MIYDLKSMGQGPALRFSLAFNCQLSIVNYQLFRTFACELMWIDLYCLQPQEKMLKTSPF